MLVRLFEVLAIDILSSWCDLKTVTKVNSAFCNNTERSNFLFLFNDPSFGSTDSVYPNSDPFWKWIVSNGIKVQHMKGKWSKEMSELLATKVDCSKVIEFHVNLLEKVQHVAKLINNSIHLNTLTVDDSCAYTADGSLNEILSLISNQIWAGLIGLTLARDERRFIIRDFVDLSSIAIACTQLHSLSLFLGGDCYSLLEDQLIQNVRNNKQLQQLSLDGRVSCETALLTTIAGNCTGLQSLTISYFYASDCSVESVCAMVTCCKQLTSFEIGHENFLSASDRTSKLLKVSIWDFHFIPIFPTILGMYINQLEAVELYHLIEESLVLQISLKCPHLIELYIFESLRSCSVYTLRSIVTRCTKLETLYLKYVDATYDEMVSIFCSEQVLVLIDLCVLTTTPFLGLTEQIKNHNPSVEECKTVPEN